MCTWAQMHVHSMCANIKGSPPESCSPTVRMECLNRASAQAAISTGMYSRRCQWTLCWEIGYESLASCYLRALIPHLGNELTSKRICGDKSCSSLLFLPPTWGSEDLTAGWFHETSPILKSCKNRHHFCHPGSDSVLRDTTVVSFFGAESWTLLEDLIISCLISFLINPILSSNLSSVPIWSQPWQIKLKSSSLSTSTFIH